ncbi:MAG: hypothetical protein LAT68_15515 [Cyclobacteriaceae bacterium]|nr:hypothetical protein [Cyclobacteriaceae bacterium]MCH8517730.1 hypothetical protein [Cyclobacteriaceae bacterium]
MKTTTVDRDAAKRTFSTYSMAILGNEPIKMSDIYQSLTSTASVYMPIKPIEVFFTTEQLISHLSKSTLDFLFVHESTEDSQMESIMLYLEKQGLKTHLIAVGCENFQSKVCTLSDHHIAKEVFDENEIMDLIHWEQSLSAAQQRRSMAKNESPGTFNLLLKALGVRVAS